MISEILNNEARSIIQEVQSNIQSANKNASGQTSQSLDFSIDESESRLTLIIDAVRHFPVLEKGRRPGKMPPVSKIREWTRQRGLPEGLAFGISKAIAQKGTKLFQEGGRTDIYSNVINDQRIADILKRIADASAEDAENRIKQEVED